MLCVSNLSQFPTVAQCSSVFAAVEVRITLQGIWHAKLQGHWFGLWSQIKVTTDTAAVSVTLADKQGSICIYGGRKYNTTYCLCVHSREEIMA